jgi:hypothetical protein
MSTDQLATEPIQPVQPELTEAQLDDFAALLAKTVTRGNIAWLATSVLGSGALWEAANDVGDVSAFARRIVDVLATEGRIPDAVALLRQEAHRNSYLNFGLNHILRGGRLDDSQATQAFVNEYEPFLSSGAFQERFPRVMRTVCAIGLVPEAGIVGSGFLIAPDLVMTNYHTLKTFLDVGPDGQTIVANGPGDQIFCFFDYLWEPAPKVPPVKQPRHASLVVEAAKDWLVYARKLLPYDGTPQCPKEVGTAYDYAVIRLKRPVGKLPARLSGGGIRGWLPMPQAIDVLGQQKRIIVFQHPETAPQQFDIGDFVQLDRSGTRVWYSVSTAKGSSGGAAVDSDGQLFALHNAEVQAQVTGQKRLNQGVRIDRIAEDLAAAVPQWNAAPAPAEDPLAFWSLSDDPREPQPIIGRTKFRENVHAMTVETGERLMVVTGMPGSGRRFSIDLLRRTLGSQTPVVVFSPKDLQTLSPKDFLRVLVNELGLVGLTGKPPIPDPQSTETIPRWLREDLPKWLLDRLTEDQALNRARYPAWIVINSVTEPEERLFWGDNLKDFVVALAGFHDPGQTAVDLPHLRWLFLGSKPETLPVRGVRPQDEDLSGHASDQQDFADCLQLAWSSVDKTSPLIPETFLTTMAAMTIQSNAGRPSRKVLADLVRNMVLAAPDVGGQP